MRCIDCDKDFPPPADMPGMPQCYDCWSEDCDQKFGSSQWTTKDTRLAVFIIVSVMALIGLAIYENYFQK